MKARTATVGDLERVFADLSERLSEEFVASGTQLRAAADSLLLDLNEGRAHSLLDGDDVRAIITWHENEAAAYTLFAAMDEFFHASTVRFCHEHIRQIQQLTGNLPVRHRSWINRPDVGKWFRILGFRERSKSQDSTVWELAPAAVKA